MPRWLKTKTGLFGGSLEVLIKAAISADICHDTCVLFLESFLASKSALISLVAGFTRATAVTRGAITTTGGGVAGRGMEMMNLTGPHSSSAEDGRGTPGSRAVNRIGRGVLPSL